MKRTNYKEDVDFVYCDTSWNHDVMHYSLSENYEEINVGNYSIRIAKSMGDIDYRIFKVKYIQESNYYSEELTFESTILLNQDSLIPKFYNEIDIQNFLIIQ